MYNKGSIITGDFNVKLNDSKYEACTRIYSDENKEYLRFSDIVDYNIELFPYYKDVNIVDGIDVMEALTDSGTFKFTSNQFLNNVSKYNFVLINQKNLSSLLTNEISYKIKYMEGIEIKGKTTPIYILPKDNNSVYLINVENDIIKSYIKLDTTNKKYTENYLNRYI